MLLGGSRCDRVDEENCRAKKADGAAVPYSPHHKKGTLKVCGHD